MMTDRKSLFDVLTKTNTTMGKRMVIDLQTVKDADDSFRVGEVALKQSEFNIEDELSMVQTNSILLKKSKAEK